MLFINNILILLSIVAFLFHFITKKYNRRSRNCLSYAGIWDHPPFFFRLYSVLCKLLIVSLDYPFFIALLLSFMVLFCHYHLIKTYYRVSTKMSNEDYSFLTRVSYLNNKGSSGTIWINRCSIHKSFLLPIKFTKNTCCV
jgi:hypothetical protein